MVGRVHGIGRVVLDGVIVGIVPLTVKGSFDNDEDGEDCDDDVFECVDSEVPALWALPARILGLGGMHGCLWRCCSTAMVFSSIIDRR